MNKELKQLRDLLQSSIHEIKNLRLKLQNNEPEGWEGSRRRFLLEKNSEEAVKKADAILKAAQDGDGI